MQRLWNGYPGLGGMRSALELDGAERGGGDLACVHLHLPPFGFATSINARFDRWERQSKTCGLVGCRLQLHIQCMLF